jgi:TPR repeat protein
MAVKQNYQQSISLYNKACDGGSAKGCYFLASSYYNGKGVVMDHQKAMELFSKACSMGDQNGCNMAK